MGLSTPDWERRYSRKLLITDNLIIVICVLLAQFLRFGEFSNEVRISILGQASVELGYLSLSCALAIGWCLALAVGETRTSKIYGTGPLEYKRVVNMTLLTFGIYAILAFAVRAQIGRGYMLIALPIGLMLLLFSRWLWRKRLYQQRRKGLNVYRTLIVGESVKCTHVAREIAQNPYLGFSLLGAVTEKTTAKELLQGIPVVGGYNDLLASVDKLNIDTLIMTSSDSIGPEQMRRIGWDLEARQIDLIVASALTDIAGPRIHTRPVSGLPLIHIEYPKLSGSRQFAKRMFDLLTSAGLLLVLSPLFLIISIAIRSESVGPVIFKQRRVGLGGREFSMLKFRSMVVSAENQLPGLLDRSDGNGMLFKLKSDPRVTKVGKFLRKYSLDELPQLINVLKGEMSLVGPRPSLPSEVDKYEDHVRRRLLVKPGIAGLWQVSGRSNLSWEDSVRIDLFYVENWSMTGDLLILWRTIRAVLQAEGAY